MDEDIDDGFALSLIAAEEARLAANDSSEDVKSETSVVIEQSNFRKQTPFSPSQISASGVAAELPFRTNGHLESVSIVSNSTNFSLEVVVDDYNVIDRTYSELQTLSAELPKASAYEDSGQYIISVFDYSFDEFFNMTVAPGEEILFDLVRVELTLNA